MELVEITLWIHKHNLLIRGIKIVGFTKIVFEWKTSIYMSFYLLAIYIIQVHSFMQKRKK